MERVTFLNTAVIDQVNDNFVAIWRNWASEGATFTKLDMNVLMNRPGAQQFLSELDEPVDEQAELSALSAGIPNGVSSEDIATIFATARGEVLHVAPGLWNPEEYLREIQFALSVNARMDEAGGDVERRHEAVVAAHKERLVVLNKSWSGTETGRRSLKVVSQRVIRQPLHEAREWAEHQNFAVAFAEKPVTVRIHHKVEQFRGLFTERLKQRGDDPDLKLAARKMQHFEGLVRKMQYKKAELNVDQALEILARE